MPHKHYRTAKTLAQIGKIPAGTYVAVYYCYTSSSGLAIFTIRTSLVGGIEECEVPENLLEKFCL